MIRRAASQALAFAGSLAAIVGLAGCVGGGTGYALLARPADASDELPVALPPNAFDEIEPDTLRYAATHDGERLYLAKGTAEGTVCLLVLPEETDDWELGCGGNGGTGLQVTQTPAGPYTLRADGTRCPTEKSR